MLRLKRQNNKNKYICPIIAICLITGCQSEKRRFDNWRWSWPEWWKKSSSAEQEITPKPLVKKSLQKIRIGRYFDVRILDSTTNNECLQTIWSYLDELSPVSRDWQVLHRNGIRAGVGQYSDWPALKQQLEKCGTKLEGQIQLALGSFRSTTLITDKLRQSRTLFYYDNDGKFHGKDYGPSQLRLTITSAGKVTGNRVRIILVPKIVIPRARFEEFTNTKIRRKTDAIENEFEKFSITIDVGPEEFVLVGISNLNLPDSLLGTQLFTQWKNGQKHSLFVLLSPMTLEPTGKGEKGK